MSEKEGLLIFGSLGFLLGGILKVIKGNNNEANIKKMEKENDKICDPSKCEE